MDGNEVDLRSKAWLIDKLIYEVVPMNTIGNTIYANAKFCKSRG